MVVYDPPLWVKFAYWNTFLLPLNLFVVYLISRIRRKIRPKRTHGKLQALFAFLCIVMIINIWTIAVEIITVDRIEYRLEIRFEPDQEGIEYTIIVPYPMRENETKNRLTKRLNDIRSGYHLEETPYGIGLNMTSDSTASLTFSGILYRRGPMPSLRIDRRGPDVYTIYSSINGSFRYYYEVTTYWSEERCTNNTLLIEGWQHFNFDWHGEYA